MQEPNSPETLAGSLRPMKVTARHSEAWVDACFSAVVALHKVLAPFLSREPWGHLCHCLLGAPWPGAGAGAEQAKAFNCPECRMLPPLRRVMCTVRVTLVDDLFSSCLFCQHTPLRRTNSKHEHWNRSSSNCLFYSQGG